MVNSKKSKRSNSRQSCLKNKLATKIGGKSYDEKLERYMD
jgi:hypothetical protein